MTSTYEQEKEEMRQRCEKQCRSIADELDALARGAVYRDESGESHNIEDENIDDVPDDWEQMSICNYFEDYYNLRYVVDGCGEYFAVKVMVACGGPNIWVDTESQSVDLFWWGDEASWPLSSDAVAEIDALFGEMWGCRC